MNLEKIGKFILELRRQKKMTQDDLGYQLNISGKSVSKWERGVNAPDISILNKLSDILGVTTTELLNGERDNKEISIESIKFYNKKSKIQYIKLFVIILIIFFFAFALLFIINNYNRFQVYSISSASEDFVVNGYIIFNNKLNIITINKIEYMDKYIGTEQEIKAKSADIFLKCDDEILYSSGKGFFDSTEVIYLEEYINDKTIFLNNMYENEEYVKFDTPKLNQLFIEIVYIDLYNQEQKIKIPLDTLKELSSTKIFY